MQQCSTKPSGKQSTNGRSRGPRESSRKPISCWKCGETGHIQRNCTLKKKSGRGRSGGAGAQKQPGGDGAESITPQRQSGKRTVAELAGQSLASDNSLAPTDIFTTSTLFGPGPGLSVSGRIDGYDCSHMTVNTGSDISIIHPDLLQSNKRDHLQPVTTRFRRTVTGSLDPLWMCGESQRQHSVHWR